MQRWVVMAASVVCLSGTAMAQSYPIKMGLWENKVTMTGMGGDRTSTSQRCLTPEGYEKALSAMGAPPQGCTFQNSHDDHGITIHANCSMPNGVSMQMNGQVTILDQEHIKMDIHTTMTMLGHAMESHIEGTDHFVKADCGSVKPEQ